MSNTDLTYDEARKFKAASAQGARDFNSLPVDLKWRVSDDLVLGAFDWTDWLEERPPKGWRTGFGNAADAWVRSVCG